MMSEAEENLQKMIDELDIPLPSNDTCVQLLDEAQLLSRFNAITQELLERGEALSPNTQTGRDLHSEREAIKLEQIRRRVR